LQSDDAVNPDRLYDLVAVVIHCGSGPNRGHYISIVKSHGFWLLFDDDMVDVSVSTSIPVEHKHLHKTVSSIILITVFNLYF
jgi:ubiquitin C-terminal hydrolase